MSSGASSTRDQLTATRARRADRVSLSVVRLLATLLLGGAAGLGAASPPGTPLSPNAIVARRDGTRLYVAAGTANVLLVLDAAGTLQSRVALPGPPSGLALSPDETRLAVTCAAPAGTLCLVDLQRGSVASTMRAGHTAMAPVFSRDGHTVFVAHRFTHEIAFFDLATQRQTATVSVEREPIALALTPDGRRLFVANHLHAGAADAEHVAAGVSVVDVATRRVEQTLRLPNGSGLLFGVAVSPDGRYAAVTHNLARFHLPTTQLDRGWMNTAALTLIDAATPAIVNTVLLDNVERGAANPWAVAWTADGAQLLVTHAGTHEVSIIDASALLRKLTQVPAALPAGRLPDFTQATNIQADVSADLAFLVGLRRRVSLTSIGPRALAVANGQAWIPGYFSDTLAILDLGGNCDEPRTVPLGPPIALSNLRRGELYFNDARLCFQQWQSCASCHSYDARVDALNWDLLNDGLGSPKNVKSLLLAHRTPPAMSLGVRRNAETAVRAGLRHILFAAPPPEVADALDDYLSALRPMPSPRLENGRLSTAARRGEKIFADSKVGCATCHAPALFTDLKSYAVGTHNALERDDARFDTPTLVELWRTGPYLHDGSAATLREVLTTRNSSDRHGVTTHLRAPQIDDLVAYLLSL